MADLESTAPPWPLGQPDNAPPPPESMRQRAQQLVGLLGRLPDPDMRVGVVLETLRTLTHEEGATFIAEILRGTHQDAAGRTARIALALALGDSDAGVQRAVEGMRREAELRGDEAVSDLLRRRSAYKAVRPDHLPAPPAGSPSRELSLGERRALARRPNRQSLEKLMIDPDPRVIRNLLRNPRLTEDDVVRLAARRPCTSAVLAEVYASRRWISRPRIQLALVLNPYNRSDISRRLLEVLPLGGLKEAATERTIDPLVRHAALAALGVSPRAARPRPPSHEPHDAQPHPPPRAAAPDEGRPPKPGPEGTESLESAEAGAEDEEA